MRRNLLLFLGFGLLYAGGGLLPGYTLLPLDLLADYDAFKADPAIRLRASNSLLSDPLLAFVPWDAEVRRLLAAGEMPWVNTFAGEGGPLWANPQTALFSPFTWPRLFFGFKGWALAAWLKLALAGFAACFLALELGVARREALVSGLVYAGSGFMVVWLLFPLSNVAVFLPLLLAASLRLMARPSRGAAALVFLAAALVSAGGHPETLFLGVSAIFLFLLLEARARPELGWPSLRWPAIFAGLGFLLLAVSTWPFLLLLRASAAAAHRAEVAPAFRPWAVLSQLLPGALGSPLAGELDLSALVLAENFNNRAAGFVGVLVLIAFGFCWRELPPPLRRGLAIGVAALLLSFCPPGLTTLAKKVPVLGLAAFEYLAVVFVLFAALAAGPALAHLASQRRRRLGLALLAAGLLAAVAGLLPALPPAKPLLVTVARAGIESLRSRGHLQQRPEVYQQRLAHYLEAAGATTWHRLALPGLCLFLAGWALARQGGSREQRQLLLAAAAVGELLVFGWGLNPAVPRTAIPEAPEAVATVRRLDPQGQFLVASHLTVFPANLATLYGLRDLVAYDVLTSSSRVAVLERAGYDPASHSLRPRLESAEVVELGRLGVRYVLSREDVPGATRQPGMPPPAVGVYEIAGAVPQPRPSNLPPAGIGVGLSLSLLTALAATCGIWFLPK